MLKGSLRDVAEKKNDFKIPILDATKIHSQAIVELNGKQKKRSSLQTALRWACNTDDEVTHMFTKIVFK